jgi:hypothetical protein
VDFLRMALWDEHGTELATLVVYGAGIALYTLAVIALYVPMSTRMMFARRFGDHAIATPGRRFAYVLFFPLLSFLFFLLVAGSMAFLADFSAQDEANRLGPRDIMTISMAVVLAIRICAYFSEEAAKDLARVMPLGLLGVILVTNKLSDLQDSLGNLRAFVEEAELLGLFFLVVVVLEFLLRAIYELLGRPRSHKGPR